MRVRLFIQFGICWVLLVCGLIAAPGGALSAPASETPFLALDAQHLVLAKSALGRELVLLTALVENPFTDFPELLDSTLVMFQRHRNMLQLTRLPDGETS